MTGAVRDDAAHHASQDAELRRLLDDVPHLTDKVVLDLINGLEVVKEHQQVRGRRQGFFDRACDSITGKGARRQQLIDQNLAAGLESAAIWLQNLQAHQIRTDLGLELVSTKLTETRSAVRALGDAHVKLRDRVGALEAELVRFAGDVDQRFATVQRTLRDVKLKQDARSEMDRLFAAWDAGERFQGLPPLVQVALALETLYWTKFRHYDRQEPEVRDELRQRCTSQLRRLTGTHPDALIAVGDWYLPVSRASLVVREMVGYAIDVSDRETTPIRATLVAAAEADGEEIPWSSDRAPARLPQALGGRGLAQKIVRETAEGTLRRAI